MVRTRACQLSRDNLVDPSKSKKEKSLKTKHFARGGRRMVGMITWTLAPSRAWALCESPKRSEKLLAHDHTHCSLVRASKISEEMRLRELVLALINILASRLREK